MPFERRASASALSIAATRDFLLSSERIVTPPHRRLPGDVGDRGVLAFSPLRPASRRVIFTVTSPPLRRAGAARLALRHEDVDIGS